MSSPQANTKKHTRQAQQISETSLAGLQVRDTREQLEKAAEQDRFIRKHLHARGKNGRSVETRETTNPPQGKNVANAGNRAIVRE